MSTNENFFADDTADDTADNTEVLTIPLSNVLKLAGFVGTGGEAKVLIQAGEVRVNGEVETRRKRKIREGDVIAVGDEEIVVGLEDM